MPEQTEKQLTGYPSIDKPWMKYYSEEAINSPLPELTMYQYIWENNKDHLSDIALRYYGTKVTYEKLFESIQKAANAFYAMGVRAGDIVTIMSMHTPEAIYSIYGLNYIGAVANMVYMTLAEKEILHTLENTKSKLFLVLDAALERVDKIKDEISCPIVVLGVADSMPAHMKIGYRLKAKPMQHGFLTWKGFLKQGAIEPPMFTVHAAPAVIVYTSGTTGEPKGVVLSSDNINTLAFQFLISGFKFGRRETYLDIIPTFLGYGIGMIATAINAGLDTTLWIQLKPELVASEMERLKPNHVEIGVAFIDAILDGTHGDLSQIINFAGGGGSISIEKEREINNFLRQHSAKTHFIMGYGMTEFASSVCNNLHSATKEGSCGVPFPYANVKILQAETKQELTYGEIGEICFSAPNMMLGYYQNKVATDEVISCDEQGTRWLHTGDLGFIDKDGFLFIAGRIKRISYTRLDDGTVMRLFPQRVEEYLESLPYVEKCGVIVIEHETRISVAVAFVTLDDKAQNRDLFLSKLTVSMRKELPSHSWAEKIIILDSMPMTPSGKIDYQTLEKMAKSI